MFFFSWKDYAKNFYLTLGFRYASYDISKLWINMDNVVHVAKRRLLKITRQPRFMLKLPLKKWS